MSDATTPGHTDAARPYGKSRKTVPPFARYKGTSAWRKSRVRVRAYARFLAAAKQAKQGHEAPGH